MLIIACETFRCVVSTSTVHLSTLPAGKTRRSFVSTPEATATQSSHFTSIEAINMTSKIFSVHCMHILTDCYESIHVHVRLTNTAENPSILTGSTHVHSKPVVPTLSEVFFISIAVDIVQDHERCSRSKVRGLCCSCSWYRNMPKRRLHMQVNLVYKPIALN